MNADNLLGQIDVNTEHGNRWVGVYIGALAGLLAICNVGADNATKEAVQANLGATDTWSFFQAKNIRRTMLRVSADQLELLVEAQQDLGAAVRRRFSDRIRDYRKQIDSLSSNKETGEGLDDLFGTAKNYEAKRNIALQRDPYFDWSQALLQIAVVLASVHLIVGSGWLLRVSNALAVVGVLLMVNGFSLLVRLPGLG